MTSLLPILLLVAASPLPIPQATYAKAPSKLSSRSSIVKRKQPSVQKRQGSRTPKKTALDIEQFVREDLKTPQRERVEHWNYSLDKDKKRLSVMGVGAPISLDPNDPYILPLVAQYNVESLALFLKDSDIPVSIWRPRLKVIRDEIYRAIVDLQSIKNRERLLESLQRRASRIDGNLAAMKDLIIKFYGDKGYEVNLGSAQTLLLPVPVATDPSGGTIRVMKYLNYRKCLAFAIQKSLWPWLTLNQDTAPLLGRYHYFVSWPDGRIAEGDMRIVSRNPVVFRQQ